MNHLHPAKLARMQRGLRQIDLTLKTGISPSAISHYENGLKEPPPDKARVLNEVLGKNVYDEGS